MKNKHCEIIKAYADGAEVQVKTQPSGIWADLRYPAFRDHIDYRIKPPPASGFATELDQHVLALQTSIEKINRLKERINAWEKQCT